METRRIGHRTPASEPGRQAKIAATAVAVGGKAVLRGVSRQVVSRALQQTAGTEVARGVMRGGSKVAARVAPVLAVVEFGIDQRRTAAEYRAGRLSCEEYHAETGGNVGNAAGGLGGAWGGAALGTAICPGLGTIIGAILGGLAGGVVGREFGRDIGSKT